MSPHAEAVSVAPTPLDTLMLRAVAAIGACVRCHRYRAAPRPVLAAKDRMPEPPLSDV